MDGRPARPPAIHWETWPDVDTAAGTFATAEVKSGDNNPYARTTGSKRDAHGI